MTISVLQIRPKMTTLISLQCQTSWWAKTYLTLQSCAVHWSLKLRSIKRPSQRCNVTHGQLPSVLCEKNCYFASGQQENCYFSGQQDKDTTTARTSWKLLSDSLSGVRIKLRRRREYEMMALQCGLIKTSPLYFTIFLASGAAGMLGD